MKKKSSQRVNREIRAKQVRLIDHNGEQRGDMELKQALKIAEDANLDLVEVAPDAKPPVVKVMDYGRARYREEKKQRQNRKARTHAHQLRLTPVIAEHDLDTKRRAAERFLKKGDQVRISVQMRGRQKAHPEMARELIDRLIEELSEFGSPMRPPSQDANAVQVTLGPV